MIQHNKIVTQSLIFAVVFGSIYRTDHSNESVFLTEPINVTLELNDVYQALAIVDDGSNTIAGHLRFDYSFPSRNEHVTVDYSSPMNIDGCTSKIVQLVSVTFNKTVLNDNVTDNLIIIDVCFHYVNHISRNETSKHAKIHLLMPDPGTDTTTSSPTSSVSHTESTVTQSPCPELAAVLKPETSGSSRSALCGKYEHSILSWFIFGIFVLTGSLIL